MSSATAAFAAGATLAAVIAGVAYYRWRCACDHEEVLALCEEVCSAAERKLESLEAEIQYSSPTTEGRSRDRWSIESDHQPLYRSLDTDLGPSSPSPPGVSRFDSSAVKQAVNRVLLPKLLALQQLRQTLRSQNRKRQLGRVEMTRQINEAARAFDERYADAIRAATSLAEELPPEATEIPLKRLTSSDEAWEMVQKLQASMEDLQTLDAAGGVGEDSR